MMLYSVPGPGRIVLNGQGRVGHGPDDLFEDVAGKRHVHVRRLPFPVHERHADAVARGEQNPPLKGNMADDPDDDLVEFPENHRLVVDGPLRAGEADDVEIQVLDALVFDHPVLHGVGGLTY